MNGRRLCWPRLTALTFAATLGMAGTWLATNTVNGQRRSADKGPSLPPVTERVAQPASSARAGANDLSRAFREASRAVLPAVVVIKAPNEMACPHCGRIHSGAEGEEESLSQEMPGEATRKDSLAVLGSGFLVDPSGLVVTNQHVVGSARRIVVQLSDGRQFRAAKAGEDRSLDLAILKVEADGPLPAAQLADSEMVEIGDWVLAVGCPLELEQTVSAGIISAKNRSFCRNHRARMLQTDAVINPGSSGGPLVDLEGRVIGITTSIASEDGGYQGIGFAVPANHALRLLAGASGGQSRQMD